MKIFLACRPILVTYTKRFANQENLLELNKCMFKIISKCCQIQPQTAYYLDFKLKLKIGKR